MKFLFLSLDRSDLLSKQTRFPYAELLPLRNYPPAEEFCSRHYPLPPTTVTRTVEIPTTAVVTVPKTDHTATSTTRIFTSTVYKSTATSYVYTATVTATSTTGTSTQTVYTNTEIDTVYTQTNVVTEYTSTSTDYQTTGTDIVTVTVATLPTTTTTATITITSFATQAATATVSSGTITVYTTVDTGLQKRHDFRDALLPRLAACERQTLKTACSCIDVHPPTHTVTTTARCTHTSFKTVGITKTVYVIGTTTKNAVSTTTISTASKLKPGSNTIDADNYHRYRLCCHLQDVETDTTNLDSTSTLSTVFVTEVPTAATATSSVTYFSPVDVAVTTTVPTTPTTTVAVPAATTTVATDVAYSLVFGPQDGCAYVLEADFLDQYSQDIPNGTTHDERAAICAAFCDRTPRCKTFGMNWFPTCGANGESVYCIASQDSWAGSGTMECGIGTGYNGCSIYQDGTVYQ
ncbi:hypothetical protein M441DRAFT_457952 [Trichoderma asperellum CBS 433.97]|uniref:Uncharacterized protein n=1 Tax=Trichoderma asperellum (strain ATCC 204424 / CBS 433.97 / NBRC 101777) TaxID=1042311 RepID=A0A2T3ZAR2_TRIA4|nr:hypothetical protein M441DRAFT_457952 [Trichoderma asperellum CBS 433.97]PTB41901.1 hypothetical protein M441DRAFT_457952 [Trichoderma asperellum CBS 433.97]